MDSDVEKRFATAREFRLALPEVTPNQDELLGAVVRESCAAALVDLERKTERATRPHGTAAITRAHKATPSPAKQAPEASEPIALGLALKGPEAPSMPEPAPVAPSTPPPAPAPVPAVVAPTPVPPAAPAARAVVSIDASPWGQVWLDGRPLGDTPVAELKVMNPETGKSNTQKLVLKAGERRTVRVDLR